MYRIVTAYQLHLLDGKLFLTEFTLGSHLPKMLFIRCLASSSCRPRVSLDVASGNMLSYPVTKVLSRNQRVPSHEKGQGVLVL
jgi:hypothetical protein